MHSNILTEDILSFTEDFAFRNELREKHFLITGATGLLGSIMTKCLFALNEKYQLHLSLTCPVRDLQKAELIYGENFSPGIFKQVDIREIHTGNIGSEIDYILHFAAPTASRYFIEHPVETFETIVGGTEKLLSYAQNLSHLKGFVYISSLEVYGSILDDSEPVTEEKQGYINPLDVRSCYSLGKRAAECLCHAYAAECSMPVVIARLTQTFGAGIASSDQRVFAQFARSVCSGTDILLHTAGLSAKPYCYTTDATSALLYILLRGESGTAYNVANESTYISIRSMAEFVREHFAPQINVKIEEQTDCGYAPTTRLKLDCTRLQKLGWTPRYDLLRMFQNLINSLK